MGFPLIALKNPSIFQIWAELSQLVVVFDRMGLLWFYSTSSFQVTGKEKQQFRSHVLTNSATLPKNKVQKVGYAVKVYSANQYPMLVSQR